MNEKKAEQLSRYDLFTTSNEETQQVASELKKIGCCPRCTIRFLGESNPQSYRCQIRDLETVFETEEDTISNSPSPCPGCLGILQNFAQKDFFLKIITKVEEDGYSFTDYQCSLMLPVCLIVRQRAIHIHLCKTFGDVYPGQEHLIPSVKDVWKWSCGPSMSDLLGARFQNRSQFDILLTFEYADSDKECSFLLDVDPDTFRQRKQRKYAFETFTRANVGKALTGMSDSKFEGCFACPPSLPVKETTSIIACNHDSVFVAGRYLKYSRILSQTPWFVNGKRIFEGSVEDIICDPMTEMFKPTEHRLSSSGREDVDVRMLGTGRPFVIELVNPHCVKFSKEDLKHLQQKINESSKDVQVRDLQIVSRENLQLLKDGETEKTKTYTAFCWCERELTGEDLDSLSQMKDLVLHQKTPLRVLHRRSAMTRDRTVHSIKAEKLEDNHRFKLSLQTQAGTYIKEFIHGDFGRTSPNMCEILKADCDITDLDVESVDVDWPPYIDPIPNKDTTQGHSDSTSSSQSTTSASIEETDTNKEEVVPDKEEDKQKVQDHVAQPDVEMADADNT